MTRNTRAGLASDVSFAPRLACSPGPSLRAVLPAYITQSPPISPQSPWNAAKYRPVALQILQVGLNIAGEQTYRKQRLTKICL
jgi:hypothetical protein